MSLLLRQRISRGTHMRPMSRKSPGLAVVQGHSVAAAIHTAEGEHPNKIIAVCHCCPFLNPFVLLGTRTRAFLLSALGCPAGHSGPPCFQSQAQHEDDFVPLLNHRCLSSNHTALNFFPAFGAFPAPGSTAPGVGCCEWGGLRQGTEVQEGAKAREGWVPLRHGSPPRTWQAQHGGTGVSGKKLLV